MKKRKKLFVVLGAAVMTSLFVFHVMANQYSGNQKIQNLKVDTEAATDRGTIYDKNDTGIEKREMSESGKIVYNKNGTVVEKREISETEAIENDSNGKVVYDKNGTVIEKRELSTTETE